VAVALQEGSSSAARVDLAVAPAGVAVSLDFNLVSRRYEGFYIVPAGFETVTATAYDTGGGVMGTGTVDLSVVPHGTASASLTITSNTLQPGVAHGPVVAALTASSLAPSAGEPVTLTVVGVDPDGSPLTYQWSTDCLAGVFTAPTSATTNFTENVSLATCRIVARVTAGGLSDSALVTLTIQTPTGTPQVDATFVPAPYIKDVAYQGSAGTSCVIPRDTFDATCRPAVPYSDAAAVRVDFDPPPAGAEGINLQLSDNCQGFSTLTSLVLAAGTAQFHWTAPATGGACLLTARMVWEGLADAETIAVVVSSQPPPTPLAP